MIEGHKIFWSLLVGSLVTPLFAGTAASAETPDAGLVSGESGQACSQDADCANGQTCLNIPASSATTASSHCIYSGQCRTDADCDAAYYCDYGLKECTPGVNCEAAGGYVYTSYCYVRPPPWTTPPPPPPYPPEPCTSNATCGSGQICLVSQVLTSVNGGPWNGCIYPGQCLSDADCDATRFCDLRQRTCTPDESCELGNLGYSSQCKARPTPPPPPPPPLPPLGFCASDADCGAGLHCAVVLHYGDKDIKDCVPDSCQTDGTCSGVQRCTPITVTTRELCPASADAGTCSASMFSEDPSTPPDACQNGATCACLTPSRCNDLAECGPGYRECYKLAPDPLGYCILDSSACRSDAECPANWSCRQTYYDYLNWPSKARWYRPCPPDATDCRCFDPFSAYTSTFPILPPPPPAPPPPPPPNTPPPSPPSGADAGIPNPSDGGTTGPGHWLPHGCHCEVAGLVASNARSSLMWSLFGLGLLVRRARVSRRRH